MNKTAEVIIIGGGVVGCAAAYYLAKKGVKDVIVLEADKSIGHGGSSRNGGGVRQSGRDIRELPYAMYAIQNMWPHLSEELGVDVEYYQKGNLRLGKTEAHLKKLNTLATNAQSVGLDVRMVDGKEVKENKVGSNINFKLNKVFELDRLYYEIKTKYDILYKNLNIEKYTKSTIVIAGVLVALLIFNILNYINMIK